MGVPAFFRWLSRKYSSVLIECVEKRVTNEDGEEVSECASLPNPNGVEFDNLYLDMNGIIHPCTHPEDKPAPKNEDEMMVAIFEYIDRLFAIVRPRKVLYMAIDGVAPRAKMNQQRSRRFRASKEAAEKTAEIARVREELKAKGAILPPEKEKGEHFDSNCITPGTPFMERLSRCLHYYVHERMNNHPGWRNIKVILSDANVPGEGEHKIMDYIRRQRAQPNHDPNTQHVLCGADADLIMLGLATHEPNFTIIREEFLPNKERPCEVCSQFGHELSKCEGLNGGDSSEPPPIAKEVQFIFVRLSVLREYLERELEMPNLPFEYDFDRVIDDWVFMCFFVGNDFLPHLPSLEIRENAIDRLVTLYKKCVYKTGGYLTDSGDVNLKRVEMIMQDLGMVEDQIFKTRQSKEQMYKMREKQKRMQQKAPNFEQIHKGQFAPTALGRGIQPAAIQNPRQEAARYRMIDQQRPDTALQSMLIPEGRGTKRKSDQMEQASAQEGGAKEEEEEEEEVQDEVRLWEDGFKDRYYESKFDVMATNVEFRYAVARQYVKGLCWVLQYYYQGCASWNWYFPYHYAPFASDFINIAGQSTKFEKGTKPFNPLEQLMGVFPAASKSHIPEPWGELMIDPRSTIIDFYPEDFKIDLNGKKFAWQGVALLPFVDEKRLFKALKPLHDKLTEAEKRRNSLGSDRLYVGPGNEGYKLLKGIYTNDIDNNDGTPVVIQGMQGTVRKAGDLVPTGGMLISPVFGLEPICDNSVVTVKFKDPEYAEDFIFPAKKLPDAKEAPRVLKPGGMGNDRHYKPMIGFTRDLPQASLSGTGHRMMNHYTHDRSRDSGQYKSYPPPNQYQHHQQNQYQQRSSYQGKNFHLFPSLNCTKFKSRENHENPPFSRREKSSRKSQDFHTQWEIIKRHTTQELIGIVPHMRSLSKQSNLRRRPSIYQTPFHFLQNKKGKKSAKLVQLTRKFPSNPAPYEGCLQG
ncbi:5'-3' exoribonuclease 2 homolog isoform X1 [Lutzomyia longipalpis]|uniref:5'-3' exoribonuclease 2 homolog isoform X1 n=1 Tax=Lutzomyia longipalpis TaxID=7200 RepID=UPI002483B229|nr:5'-3' exoribonuclease 2 homolog isoform X1 [Lutzomyia longipalpis]